MIAAEIGRMRPAERAELIYAQARSDLSARLWRAALGGLDDDAPAQSAAQPVLGGSLDALLDLLAAGGDRPPAPPAVGSGVPSPLAEPRTASGASRAEPFGPAPQPGASDRATGLGVNARFEASLDRAACRTGLPAAALAAIVDAEAAKGRDGGWKTHSRNPRSSAAGLGQFLSGTWIGEAERPGTWLNAAAKARGWLGEGGQVLRRARSELLALRYDAEASINAVADYARANLDRLGSAGVRLGETPEAVAQAAYLCHHLGAGDAIRFLTDGLAPSRARTLLNAQIGSAGAARRIAAAGDAAEAHRAWLLGFVDRHIRPTRFARTEAPSAPAAGSAEKWSA